ncbi:MAG TPA: thiamine pyrophosphate-dependent enzyme [Candidatus Binataceae bacterium]|nr:thiamine pyrophosphate-dependent enzyme [Candidatus Binataceae bacterium]
MDEKLRLDIYRKMVLSRRLEERIAELIKSGQAGGFMHPGVGQEALQVAAIAALRGDDYIMYAHAGSPTGWRGGFRSSGYFATLPARRAAPIKDVAV